MVGSSASGEYVGSYNNTHTKATICDAWTTRDDCYGQRSYFSVKRFSRFPPEKSNTLYCCSAVPSILEWSGRTDGPVNQAIFSQRGWRHSHQSSEIFASTA